MRRWIFRAVLLGILVALAVWSWHTWFPGPEQIIRRKLNELARLASVNANESPLKKLATAQNVTGYFTRDVQVTVDVPGRSPVFLNGQEEIREAALSARSTGVSFTVEFLDLDIKLSSDQQSAMVELTAKATIPGERMPQVQELRVGFKKNNRDWLVNSVETVKTLH